MAYSIRPYRDADAETLARILEEAIRAIGPHAYSPDQVAAWAARHPGAERYRERIRRGDVIFVAADQDDNPVAYVLFEADGHIDHLYAHPDHTRRGLTTQLLARCDARRGIRVRLLPSPRLSRVPWETLVIEPGISLRLLDVAAIVHDLPATVRAARSRDTVPWEVAGEWPAAMIVDPVLPKTTAMQRVLATDNEATGMFLERVDANRATQGEGFYGTVGGVVGRLKLAKLLGARRSRLFYFGHVTARTDEPGSASMHLTDPAASVWGLAEPIEGHRPLSALDLLSGVQDATQEYRAQFDSVSGPDIWPMPTRVALISCEGAADYRTSETFGLVSAMVKAGAGMVTATGHGPGGPNSCR